MDANGEALADELMAILRSEVRFVLIHDVDSCPFQHILESTPRELVVAGLYKSVAVDYIAGRHEEVCAAMLAKELGAKAVRVQSLTAGSSGRLLEEGRAAAAITNL